MPRRRSLTLRAPRVGLYQSWVASMDEGWTRFVFEKEAEVPYQTLHDGDVRAGSLTQRFDVLVLAGPARALRSFTAMPRERCPTSTWAASAEGVAALKAFVEAGGTLVTFNESSKFALAELGVGARDVFADSKGSAERVGVQGLLLSRRTPRGERRSSHSPLAHGLDASSVVWFEESPAFEPGSGARAVATYVDDDPLSIRLAAGR